MQGMGSRPLDWLLSYAVHKLTSAVKEQNRVHQSTSTVSGAVSNLYVRMYQQLSYMYTLLCMKTWSN